MNCTMRGRASISLTPISSNCLLFIFFKSAKIFPRGFRKDRQNLLLFSIIFFVNFALLHWQHENPCLGPNGTAISSGFGIIIYAIFQLFSVQFFVLLFRQPAWALLQYFVFIIQNYRGCSLQNLRKLPYFFFELKLMDL